MEEISEGIRVFKILRHIMHTVKQNMGMQFKEMNLTAPQGMVIGILSHAGEMKISDLSEKLGLSNSTVSGIIDRLELQGFVERVRSQEDRRVVYVRVTPECKRNGNQHFVEIEKMFETMMHKATKEELEVIHKGLDALENVIARQK